MALLHERSGLSLVTNEFQELKTRIHERLVQVLDLSLIGSLGQEALKYEIKRVIERILSEEKSIPLNAEEKEQFCREVQDEVLGLGPLEPFMHDPTITDVLVNTYRQIYVERYGRLELTKARFKDNVHLKNVIDRIVSAVGRRIDESCPMVDARLPDGSRVNAIVPPLAIEGPMLSIRRFAVIPLEIEDLITLKTLTTEIGELLKGLVTAKLNILISGGTGTGKTTMLNVLSRFIPSHERIITIEDSAELQLKQEHVVRLETRPSNVEGKGEITQRDLVKNSLRMRPDRIILGEVRGGEVLDMLQALNTGHDGSLTTIHANTPRDALLRLETLVAMSGLNIPNEAIRKYISSAIQVIIQVSRLVDGSRKLVSLQEVIGMEGNIITMQEIFSFKQHGIDENGRVKGSFEMSRILPKFFDKFHAIGVPLPDGTFDSVKGLTRYE
ncbi:MAG: Type II/IV secretion system ATP hydrolase TadA/VirB11/CpaF, TadA subfamily [Candidatus Jettenia ecosi]|uniref:Type II/IV secretion system ATP hydrolase TadA/VirB11/CpaF, TadA subfamily n=1 Tax=Candidatus Jettenia ecosi TaxID=2494326 RepID=A0A533QAY7_9BACT|nr:MAG: Type II/IV secretion system ATP hydrolase TadA/VirB11/CpaF, TadA subfamily [Candidatus Jettenia ecosi]